MNSTNFDKSEIQQFDALASSWWDTEGPCKPLHELNPLRVQFIQEQSPVYGKNILDVGCGGGILTEALSQLGAKLKGIDLAPHSIEVAIQHASINALSIEYDCIAIEDFAKKETALFDIITCMELLEHVPDPESIIASIATLLKPGGHAFFSTIHRTPKAFLHAIVGAEYLLKLLPKGTHQYQKFIRPSELKRTLERHGLRAQRMQGITYHPLQRRYTLTADCQVNYMMHFIKEAL